MCSVFRLIALHCVKIEGNPRQTYDVKFSPAVFIFFFTAAFHVKGAVESKYMTLNGEARKTKFVRFWLHVSGTPLEKPLLVVVRSVISNVPPWKFLAISLGQSKFEAVETPRNECKRRATFASCFYYCCVVVKTNSR